MAEARLLTEEPDTAGALRRGWVYLRPHRALLALALLVTVASTAAVVGIAPVVGRGVDAVIDRDRTALWWSVGALAVVVLARLLLLRWSELLLARAGERVVQDLRDLVVERLAGAPLRFVEAHRTGDLLRRATGEIADLALFIREQVPNLLGIGLTVVLTTILLIVYSPLLALMLIVLFLPAAFAVIWWFNRVAGRAFGRQATADAAMTATFTETLAASEALVVVGRPGEWVERFRRDNDELLRASNGTIGAQNRLELFNLLEGLATAALLLLSVWLARAGHLGVGAVVVFVLATRNLFEGIAGLSRLIGQLQTARVGVARLIDLLDATDTSATGSSATETSATGSSATETSASGVPADSASAGGGSLPARGELAATELRFGYGTAGDDVLRGVSVSFPAGDRAGLVGTTGSGKTTLAKLLCGLYQPDSGAVTFGGVDLSTVSPAEIRSRIVLVPQQVHIITGSLAENLALAPGEPDRAAMERAVTALGLGEWVSGLPGGLDASVGARGELLSAGERQIVGLLRAALVDPPVLVLDEATADLDPEVARRLETAVEHLRPGRTLIVIAHRQSTIDRLPRRVGLAAGRIVTADHAPSVPGQAHNGHVATDRA
ncbi:ABC-type multidrug transport system, ATPase and permease component [Frankia sp. EI5c]|uniref:ABC transporter ATP-binding protein n=1 Tax=Frankia sp. EI5c TaxID=683316 RepID=UPI0007C40064|nr:ABC transporter ATP-binding protein [Frankia sp. EI5c]OAA24377.1 ABC-type multidrug transport system, ATPase and permease component [Frankia sp. EI5c]